MITKPINTNEPLVLTNEGKLTLLFLGVGSAFTKKLFQTNLLIIKGQDHVLIDCGTKASQALYTLGSSITKIQNFLITHSHADHVGGLEEAALMGRYLTKQKPNIIIIKAYQKILWEMSLKGGCAFNEIKNDTPLDFEDLWNPLYPKKLKNFPRDAYEINVGNINLKMIRTNHIPDSSNSWKEAFISCGLIIDDKILFSSDTKFDPDLITTFDTMYNFQTIFHDCQFFTGGVHASIEELKTMPSPLKNKMYLVHYGDNWEQFKDKVIEYAFAGLAQQHAYYIFE